MPTVRMPDGKIAQFPDGMDPAHISAEIQSHPSVAGAGPAGIPQDPGAPNPILEDSATAPLTRRLSQSFANNPGPGQPGGYDEALRPVGNAGRRTARSLASMVAHPGQAVSGMADTLAEAGSFLDPTSPGGGPTPVEDQLNEYGNTARRSGLTQAASDVAGDALTTYLAGKATGAALEHGPGLAADAANLAGRGLKRSGALVDRLVIGAPSPTDPETFGADIGGGLARNRIVGTSTRALSKKVARTVAPAAEARDAVLSRSTAGPTDISGDVAQPFDEITARKTDPVTGAARPASVKRLTTTRRAVTEVQDPNTGDPTGTPKRSDLSPSEMGQLQRNIYDMTDYDTPDSDLANQGLKGAAANVRARLNQVAPEASTMTSNVHDLLAAEDHLKRRTGAPPAATDLGPGKVSGKLYDRLRLGLGTATGASLDYLGSGLQSASGLLRQLKSASGRSPVAGASGTSPASSSSSPSYPPPGLPAPGQGTANPAMNFPSRVVSPAQPVAQAPISGVPAPSVSVPPPPVNPGGYLPASATPSEVGPPRPNTPQPALNEDTARMRVIPRGVAQTDSPSPIPPPVAAPARRLLVTPEGIRPEPLPLAAPAPVRALESRTGSRAPSQRPSLLRQLKGEATMAGITREADLAGSARKINGVPEGKAPDTAAPELPAQVPPVPANTPRPTLKSQVGKGKGTGTGTGTGKGKPATPAAQPKPGGLPAPTDIDGWESLVDEGKARYDVGSHQYVYLDKGR